MHQSLTVDHIINLTNFMKKNSCKLTELKLDQCGIEDEGAFELGDMLCVNTSLQALSITGECNIKIHGILAIAKALRVNNTLKELNFTSVEIEDEGACELGN